MRRSIRVGLTLAMVAMPLVACGALLGIEKLPIEDADATAEASIVQEAGDAGCTSSRTSCGCVPHDFCDDFDDGEDLGKGWVPYSQNPFLYNDATLVGADAGLSPPGAIQVTAGDEKNSSFAILTHKMRARPGQPDPPFSGFRSRFDMKLEKLVTTEPRGPLVDSGSAFVGGVFQLSDSFPPVAKGISVIVATDGAYLLTAGSILNVQSGAGLDGGAGGIVRLYEGDMLGLAQNWLRVDILFADRQRAISDGFGTCTVVVPGWVVAASIGPGKLKQGCLAIPDAIGPEWARDPFVTAGGGLFAGGELVFRQDNIVFDFLAPRISDD